MQNVKQPFRENHIVVTKHNQIERIIFFYLPILSHTHTWRHTHTFSKQSTAALKWLQPWTAAMQGQLVCGGGQLMETSSFHYISICSCWRARLAAAHVCWSETWQLQCTGAPPGTWRRPRLFFFFFPPDCKTKPISLSARRKALNRTTLDTSPWQRKQLCQPSDCYKGHNYFCVRVCRRAIMLGRAVAQQP